MAFGVSLKSSITLAFRLWLYLLVSSLLLLHLLCSSFIIDVLGIALLAYVVDKWRLPASNNSIVEEVLGVEPTKVDVESDGLPSLPNNNTSNHKATQYCMRVVAHRGAGLDAPENTIAAFRRAKEHGCTAVELDVSFTSDGVAIVFHDDMVNRVTESTGYINKLPWSGIKHLDLSIKHPLGIHYTGEHIPLFEDAIDECLRLGLRIFIDCKTYDDKTVSTVVGMFQKQPELYKRGIVSSFHPQLIYKVRSINPDIVCSMAWRPHFLAFEDYSSALGPLRARNSNLFYHLVAMAGDVMMKWVVQSGTLPKMLGLPVLLLHKDAINGEQVQKFRSLGIRLIAWTVNNPSEKHYFRHSLHVTYMTDTLDTEVF